MADSTASTSSRSCARRGRWPELNRLARRAARTRRRADRERLIAAAWPLARELAVLAASAMGALNRPLVDPDGAAALALAETLKRWRPRRGAAFSTCLKSRVRFRTVDQIRRDTRHRPSLGRARPPARFVSLESLRRSPEYRLIEPAAPSADPRDQLAAERAVARLFRLPLTSRERVVLQLLLAHGTQDAAARALGVTPSRIWQVLASVRRLAAGEKCRPKVNRA